MKNNTWHARWNNNNDPHVAIGIRADWSANTGDKLDPYLALATSYLRKTLKRLASSSVQKTGVVEPGAEGLRERLRIGCEFRNAGFRLIRIQSEAVRPGGMGSASQGIKAIDMLKYSITPYITGKKLTCVFELCIAMTPSGLR